VRSLGQDTTLSMSAERYKACCGAARVASTQAESLHVHALFQVLAGHRPEMPRFGVDMEIKNLIKKW